MTAALAFLGVVVLHASWLGLAAAAIVATVLRHLGAARPRQRYGVALTALLAVPPLALLCALAPRFEGAAPALASARVAVAAAPPTVSLAPATPWIGLAWALGVACGLLGLGVAVARLARLRRGARPVTEREAERLLARARERLNYRGAITLALTPEVGVPTVLGWRRPLCALPVGALRAWPGDLEWLLVHELAHVRRADVAWSWAQSFAEVALFFHPAARWLARVVRHERECCCDAEVLSRPDALVPYVHALTRLAAADRSAIRPALSVTGGTLVSRIERMIDPAVPISTSSRRLCLTLALGAAAGAATLAACETEVAPPTARVLPTPGRFVDAQGKATPVPAGSEWTASGSAETRAPRTARFIDDGGVEHEVPRGPEWQTDDSGRGDPPIPFLEWPGPVPVDTDGC